MRAFIVLIGALAVIVTAAACGGGVTSTSSVTSPSTPQPLVTAAPVAIPSAPAALPTSPITPPASSIFLGAYVDPQNFAGGAGPSGVAAFEIQIGRKLALDEHFYAWTDDFPGQNEFDDLANGRIPIDSWNCGVPNAQIVNGSQDALIAQRAQAIAAYGGPIFLRFTWEMNLKTRAGGYRRGHCYDPKTDLSNFFLSPSEFVAAWQRIREIFAANRAGNVIWLFNPSAHGANPVGYYPGDDQVDWVGFDEYDDQNVSFVLTYTSGYALVAGFNKPILIGETGAQAGEQAAFFVGAASILASQYPLVRGYNYFDAQGGVNNWILTAAGRSAFTTMANDPYFSAMP